MVNAIQDARQAQEISQAVGAKRDGLRARLPELPAVPGRMTPNGFVPAPETETAAEMAVRLMEVQQGAASGTRNSPVPNRIEPARPATLTIRPDRDGHER